MTNPAGKPIGRRSPAAVRKRAPKGRVTRGATYVKVKVVRAGQNKRLRIVVKARKVTAPTRVQTHVVVHKAPTKGKARRKG